MANGLDPWASATARPTTVGREGVAIDAGLRSYMLSVYNYMASGVLLTGIVATLFARGGVNSPAAQLFIHGGLLAWVAILAPFGVFLVLNFGINRISTTTAKALFWTYSVLMGISLSTILLVYTGSSVAQTFFATAVAFGSLSLWGYTTKRDLSAMGTFFLMGLIGLVVAMLINMFWQSGPFDMVISLIGVVIFAGLTAYHTQKIKSMYFHVADSQLVGKSVVMAALALYLDFINMFLFLLRFTGGRR